MREIVIKLSDEEYEALQRASYYSFDKYTAYIAMKSGITLPKGHGRLIDADKLEKDMNNALENSLSTYEAKVFVEFMNYVDEAPTIIEADKEE